MKITDALLKSIEKGITVNANVDIYGTALDLTFIANEDLTV